MAPTHPPTRTSPPEPNWRVAGPLLGPDAKRKLMGILTCAAVRERIQRRIEDYESKRLPSAGDDGEW